jgi:hypothetical protein
MGEIAGISGLVGGALTGQKHHWPWKAAWTGMMFISGGACALLFPHAMVPSSSSYQDATALAYGVGGFFVGAGTRLANGCTSGHGICGLARQSPRSFAAVVTFMLMAALTATTIRANDPHWLLTRPQEHAWPFEHTLPVYKPLAGAGLGFGVVLVVVSLVAAWRTSHAEIRDTWYAVVTALFMGPGILLGGMGNRHTVMRFLVLAYEWSPQLAFVMGGGLLVAYPSFKWAAKRDGKESGTMIGRQYSIPRNRVIDLRLLVGSLLFGFGWGLSGLCPGPGLLQGAGGFPMVAAFYLPAMVLGMYATHLYKTKPWEKAASSSALPSPARPLLMRGQQPGSGASTPDRASRGNETRAVAFTDPSYAEGDAKVAV